MFWSSVYNNMECTVWACHNSTCMLTLQKSKPTDTMKQTTESCPIVYPQRQKHNIMFLAYIADLEMLQDLLDSNVWVSKFMLASQNGRRKRKSSTHNSKTLNCGMKSVFLMTLQEDFTVLSFLHDKAFASFWTFLMQSRRSEYNCLW